MMQLASWLCVLLAALGAACTPDFDPIWLVKDLRVLALRADPPEVLVPQGVTTFPLVRITGLVADPRAPEALVDWTLLACTAEEINCEAAQLSLTVVDKKQTRLDQIETEFTLGAALYRAARDADLLKGFGGVPVMVELQVHRGESADRAIKRVVYGNPVPAEKTPNSNPSLDSVAADGKPVAEPWVVSAGQQVKILPQSPPSDKESYLVATYTGGQRQLTEYLDYAFFVSGGQLTNAATGGEPNPFVTDKRVDDLSTEWTPGADAARATLWVVVRDDRGGAGWVALTAQVLASPDGGATRSP